jgi:hypothetical protein
MYFCGLPFRRCTVAIKTLRYYSIIICAKYARFVLITTHNFLDYKSNKVYYIFLLFSYIYFQGRTGYPFIDAIMIQLKNEGWIHHLARHAVACFLTRGDLFLQIALLGLAAILNFGLAPNSQISNEIY